MATMEATRLRVAAGGHEALLEALRRLQTYVASFGPAVRMRVLQWHVAEATSGDISVQLVFPDGRIQAAVLDEMRRDGISNPLERALRSDRPPATLTQRVWLETTDADAPSPPGREVIAYSVFETVPGHREEADAALIAAERSDRRLGAETEVWVVRYGDASLGRYVRGLSFDSFEELRAFDEVSSTQLTVTPLDHALQSGILRRVSWALTTAIRLE